MAKLLTQQLVQLDNDRLFKRWFFDLLLSFVVHTVVLVVRRLPCNCLILTTSHLLLVLKVLVDSLHHNVPILWIDPVVVVDVPLECDAENPP